MPVDEPALQALLDRTAIHDVLLRYARGVDRRDLDLVASCFTPDAAYEGTLATGRIAEALANLRAALPLYGATMHFLGNHDVELRGDEAQSEIYALAWHELPDGRNLLVAVRYLDRLIRAGDGWRICAREARVEWRRHLPAEG